MKNYDFFGAFLVVTPAILLSALLLMVAVISFDSNIPGSFSGGVMCIAMAVTCLMFPFMIARDVLRKPKAK